MIDFTHSENSSEDTQINEKFVAKLEKLTVFQRFKFLAQEFFSPSAKTDIKLAGRIQTLQQTASQVVSKLNVIKNDLEHHTDPDLIGSIETVVNHMIRDVMRIQKKTSDPKTVEEQIDAEERYTQWIDRATSWVHLFSGLNDRDTIIQAVVKHAMHDSQEIIMRDLQVIKDYKDHKLIEIAQNENDKAELQKKIESELSGPVEDLTHLMNSEMETEPMNLEQLERWKQQIDVLRKKYYNSSMNTIDSIFQNIHPSAESKEEETHVISNLRILASLEEVIVDLQEMLKSSVYEEDEIISLLEQQEKEILTLSNELAYTPEIAGRIQEAKNALDAIRSKLTF